MDQEKIQSSTTAPIEPKWKRYLKSRMALRPPVDEDPRLLSDRMKSVILGLLALCACTPGFSSTIYFPGKSQKELNERKMGKGS